VTVKAVEKESGLERFIPGSLVDTMKKKVMTHEIISLQCALKDRNISFLIFSDSGWYLNA
jgi:hypothetical protein